MKLNKLLYYMLVLAGMVLTTIKVDAQYSRYIGNWKIVKEQSDFGGLAAKIAAPLSINLTVENDSIIVERTFDQSSPIKETLKIGGKEQEIYLDKKTLKSSKVLLDDHSNSLVFKSVYEVDGAQFIYWRIEKWTKKGLRLIVERTTIMPDKVDRVKAVYQKIK